jgi:hypothetical protein
VSSVVKILLIQQPELLLFFLSIKQHLIKGYAPWVSGGKKGSAGVILAKHNLCQGICKVASVKILKYVKKI